MDLDIIRQEIDQIYDQIVKLLEERMHLVEGVVAYKKAQENRLWTPKEKKLSLRKSEVVSAIKNTKRQLSRLFQTFSNVRAIIRIKTSNEKRTILPTRNLSSCYVGRTCPISDFEMVASQPRFSMGDTSRQLSRNFLLSLSCQRISGL